jgi:hypothetical protein
MSLTAGLPWRHPAVTLGIVLLAMSIATILHEEHLQSIGVLQEQGPLRFVMALGGSAFLAWFTVKMVGEPHAFFESTSLVNAERDKRRAKLIARAGYVVQVLSIAGILVLLWSRIR